MHKFKFLPILITCILSVTALSGCFPFGTAQEVTKLLKVSAMALPDYSVSESQLEAHPGAVPYNIHILVDPSTEPGDDDSSDPVVVTFGYVSDGMLFTGENPYGESEGTNGTTNVTKTEFTTGNDISFVYAVWTQIPQDNTETEVGKRVWYKQFALSSDSATLPTTHFGSASRIETPSDVLLDDELSEFDEDIPLFVHNGVLMYEIDIDNPPEDVYLPFGFVMASVFDSTGASSTQILSRQPDDDGPPFNEPEEVKHLMGAHQTKVEIELHPDVSPNEIPTVEDSIYVFTSYASVPLGPLIGDASPDSDVFATDVAGLEFPTIPPDTGVAIPPTNYTQIPVQESTNEDPQGNTDQPPDGLFQLNPTILDNIIIFNIPVNADSLFTPVEPHIVELPYTIWVSSEPVEELPPDFPPDYYARNPYDLEIIVIPPKGGEVQVTTPDGVKSHDKAPEGNWEQSMKYNYLIDKRQEVTLTAIPAEGWRFVAWEKSEFDFHTKIEDPHSPVLTLPITPPLKYSDMWFKSTIKAYFALIIEEPQDELPLENPLTVSISTVSETLKEGSECSSLVTVNYEAQDLTGGDKPVSTVEVLVDDTELDYWSGTPTAHYQDDAIFRSDCNKTREIKITATNSEDQTVTATINTRIPPLTTDFDYGVLDAPNGGSCQMQLFLDLEAVDKTTPESPITSVVLKANGDVWYDSGPISTDKHEHEFSILVGCGHIYTIDVIGTDEDGNTYTYRETINIPSPPPEEPPDEPPAPPPSQTTLYAAMAASANCTSSGPECSCQLSISLDGNDLTGGTYPVTRVVLRVNGSVWHDSGTISQTNYHHVENRTVNCGQTFNIQVTVNNTLGQTVTSTGSLTTPTP